MSFLDTCVGWLVYDKRLLICVGQDATAEDVLHLMQKHNVLALPVVEDTAASQLHFAGIITMLDLMTLIAFGSFKVAEPEASDFQIFQSMQLRAGDICSAHIHAEDKRVWEYDASTTLRDLLEPLSKGVHRILVRHQPNDSDPVEYRVMTQTDVVRQLLSIEDMPVLSQKVRDVCAEAEPVSVSLSGTALAAFRTLHQNSVSAAPVVDDEGAVVANVSSSDLRNLSAASLKLVLQPVLAFLGSARARGIKTALPAARPPVTCTWESSLRDVAQQMLVQRVHRVWVVNDARKPVGVVSMTDVIKAVYNAE